MAENIFIKSNRASCFLCNNRWTGEEKVKIISVPIRLKTFILAITKYREEVLSPMYQKEEKVTF